MTATAPIWACPRPNLGRTFDGRPDHAGTADRMVKHADVYHGRPHPPVGTDDGHHGDPVLPGHESFEIRKLRYFSYICTRLLDGSYSGRSETVTG